MAIQTPLNMYSINKDNNKKTKHSLYSFYFYDETKRNEKAVERLIFLR